MKQRRITSAHPTPHTGGPGKTWWRTVDGTSTTQHESRPTIKGWVFYSIHPDRWFCYYASSHDPLYTFKVTTKDNVRYYFTNYKQAHAFEVMTGGFLISTHYGVRP